MVDSTIEFIRRYFLADLGAEGERNQKGSLSLGGGGGGGGGIGATLYVGIVKAFAPTDSAPFGRETQPGNDD